MIKTICGLKGSGKTKRIIMQANNDAAVATGNVVFITDTKRYMYDLVRKVRFVDVKDYGIASVEGLLSFVKGIVAGNSDTQYVFIDGAARITGIEPGAMADFYKELEMMRGDFGLNFILTVSMAEEDLPEFIKKHEI
ncbi:MAG: hypothetical protein IKC56_01155 [Clostridia bacterium]|nr:hypothetical protein [Clostridia bacterium]